MCGVWEKGGVWFLSSVGALKTHIYVGRRFLVVSVICMKNTARSTMIVAALANACITAPNGLQNHKIYRYEGFQFHLIKISKGLF